MAVERAFIVKLIADTKELTAGLNAVGIEAEKTLGGAMNKVALASAAAFAGIAAFAFKAGEAAIQDAAEQEKLATSLRNVTGATDEVIAATEEFIAQQMRVTTFTDSEMRPALDALVRSTGDVGKAQELLALAQDLAVGTGQPLIATAEALARAQQGNFRALQALSPALRDNIKDGETFDQVLKELTSTFSGQAAAAAGTLQGQITILRNRFGEVVEEIGTALLPVIEYLIGFLGNVATFVENNTGLIIGLGVALATFTGTIVLAAAAIKVYAIASAVATAATSAFGIALTATGVGALVIAISLLVAGFVQLMIHSEKARSIMQAFFNAIIFGVEAVINSFVYLANAFIYAYNLLLKGLRLIGIDLGQVGYLSEVNFNRLGQSAASAGGQIQVVNGHLRELQNLLPSTGNLVPTVVTLTGAQAALAEATAQVTALRLKAKGAGVDEASLTAALKRQADAQRLVNDLLGDTGRKTGGASTATKEAIKPLEAYTKVLKSAQGASDNYERSTRRLRDAKKGLEKADADLIAAQEALTKAQQAGSPADIADAQRAVAAAERGLTRGKFAGEQATFAVRDAEAKLANVRADSESTAQDVREAEIALEEAKLRVKDQEDEQINTARSLEEARRKLRIATEGLRDGDKELIPLKDAVTRAEEAQIRAAEQHADAVKEQTSAIEEYRKALDELATAIINFPKVSAAVGSPGLVPIVPTPTAAPSGPAGDQRIMPDTVNINVNSSVVNPAQVGQEIYEYLQDYSRVSGDLRLSSVL